MTLRARLRLLVLLSRDLWPVGIMSTAAPTALFALMVRDRTLSSVVTMAAYSLPTTGVLYMLTAAYTRVLRYSHDRDISFGAAWRELDELLTPAPVHQPPGALVHRLLPYLVSARARERVFEPMIAEMRHEYFECLRSGPPGAAHRVLLVWYGSIAIAFLARPLNAALSLLDLVRKIKG